MWHKWSWVIFTAVFKGLFNIFLFNQFRIHILSAGILMAMSRQQITPVVQRSHRLRRQWQLDIARSSIRFPRHLDAI
jgi:hypothetical protein